MIGRLTCARCCPDLLTSSSPPLLPPPAPPLPAPPPLPLFLSVLIFQSLIATTYGKAPGAILVGVVPLLGFSDVYVLYPVVQAYRFFFLLLLLPLPFLPLPFLPLLLNVLFVRSLIVITYGKATRSHYLRLLTCVL